MRTIAAGITWLSLVAVLSHAAPAQVPVTIMPPDPMLGAWTLDLAKSKYVTPAPKSQTVTITPAPRGYTFTVDIVGADGRPQRWGFTSAFDGAESPVTGTPLIDTVVASSTGSGSTVRYMKSGNVITSTTSTVSDDGKTLVVNITIPVAQGKELTNIAVYERR